MPPKLKSYVKEGKSGNESRKLKNTVTTELNTATVKLPILETEKICLATTRPRREAKVVHDPVKEEEDAQLERAIRLSLQAQKAEKQKKKIHKEEACCSPVVTVNKAKVIPHSNRVASHSLSKSSKQSLKRKYLQKPAKTHVSAASTKSPTKKVKTEKSAAADKLQNKQPVILPEKKEDIPSTASFISYVLQKGSRNRDLDLVKQFEKEDVKDQPRLESSTIATNTATESESEEGETT